MVRVLILMGVVADGKEYVAGDTPLVSESCAAILYGARRAVPATDVDEALAAGVGADVDDDPAPKKRGRKPATMAADAVETGGGGGGIEGGA